MLQTYLNFRNRSTTNHNITMMLRTMSDDMTLPMYEFPHIVQQAARRKKNLLSTVDDLTLTNMRSLDSTIPPKSYFMCCMSHVLHILFPLFFSEYVLRRNCPEVSGLTPFEEASRGSCEGTFVCLFDSLHR